MKKSKPIYTKVYSRDFTLPLVEAWCKGETTDRRQWTNKKQPIVPYQVFIRHDGMVNCYADQTGIDWIKKELKKLLKTQKGFTSNVVKTYYERAGRIRDVYEGEKVLDGKSLVKFIENLEDAWVWHEANWFLMEILDEAKHKDFEQPNQARIALQRMVPSSDEVIRKSLKKIYPKLKQYSSVLLLDEIRANKPPALTTLKLRFEKYSYADKTLFVGSTEKDMEQQFNISIEKNIQEKVKEFKGQTAYKGTATGRVRFIMNRAQVSSIRKGEILVSPMTMPEFVPAMKKASAIVTDEGGITCHAAIVARELKKPCIIGTKIATQVLKDGDLVEVDANKGLVRLLQSKEGKYANNHTLFSIENISSIDWRKNWAGTWSLLECLSYGYEYTSLLKETWGIGLEMVLFKIENGRSENYIPADTIKQFSEHLAQQLQTEGQLKLYISKLESLVNECLHYLKKKKIRNFSDYLELWDIQDKFLVYNFPTKRLPEYLSEHLAKKYLAEFQRLRVLGEPIYAKSQKSIQEFAKGVSKKTNLPLHLVMCFTRLELQNYFENGIIPNLKLLENRYKFSILAVSGNEYKIFTEHKATSIFESITKTKITDKLQGQTAYPGIVKGKVKIVHDPTKAGVLPLSFILVTGMTRPEYLSLFKQATAVITDAGGILSHAAITARELQKPTIIGTEIATKILKDGDLVEVDADKGIVKLIKK